MKGVLNQCSVYIRWIILTMSFMTRCVYLVAFSPIYPTISCKPSPPNAVINLKITITHLPMQRHVLG